MMDQNAFFCFLVHQFREFSVFKPHYELCDGKTYDPKKQYCKLAATVENYGWLEDARDEPHIQIYKTVEICNDGETSCQTWMAENLNYSVDPGERSWCGGGSRETVGDCSKYGRLYTWTAAVGKTEDECGYGKVCDLPSGNVSGVCPEGWHLPSDDEWNTLFIAAGGIGIAGQKLKSNTNLWKQEEGISNDDSFGFAALPAGYRYYGEIFYEEGEKAYFWSATTIFHTKMQMNASTVIILRPVPNKNPTKAPHADFRDFSVCPLV